MGRPIKTVSKQEKEALNLVKTMSATKASKITGINYQRIRSLKNVHKIKRENYRFTVDEINQLNEAWNINILKVGLSMMRFCELQGLVFKKTKWQIYRELKRQLNDTGI